MMSRPFRKFRVAAEITRIRKHVPILDIAEAVGYSKHTVYAWLNDPKAAPTEEQFHDVMEWTRAWTREYDSKQARPMMAGRKRKHEA
jgi:hypothetical protein